MSPAILSSPISLSALITSVHDAEGYLLNHKSKSPILRSSTLLKSAVILLASAELIPGRRMANLFQLTKSFRASSSSLTTKTLVKDNLANHYENVTTIIHL